MGSTLTLLDQMLSAAQDFLNYYGSYYAQGNSIFKIVGIDKTTGNIQAYQIINGVQSGSLSLLNPLTSLYPNAVAPPPPVLNNAAATNPLTQLISIGQLGLSAYQGSSTTKLQKGLAGNAGSSPVAKNPTIQQVNEFNTNGGTSGPTNLSGTALGTSVTQAQAAAAAAAKNVSTAQQALTAAQQNFTNQYGSTDGMSPQNVLDTKILDITGQTTSQIQALQTKLSDAQTQLSIAQYALETAKNADSSNLGESGVMNQASQVDDAYAAVASAQQQVDSLKVSISQATVNQGQQIAAAKDSFATAQTNIATAQTNLQSAQTAADNATNSLQNAQALNTAFAPITNIANVGLSYSGNIGPGWTSNNPSSPYAFTPAEIQRAASMVGPAPHQVVGPDGNLTPDTIAANQQYANQVAQQGITNRVTDIGNFISNPYNMATAQGQAITDYMQAYFPDVVIPPNASITTLQSLAVTSYGNAVQNSEMPWSSGIVETPSISPYDGLPENDYSFNTPLLVPPPPPTLMSPETLNYAASNALTNSQQQVSQPIADKQSQAWLDKQSSTLTKNGIEVGASLAGAAAAGYELQNSIQDDFQNWGNQGFSKLGGIIKPVGSLVGMAVALSVAHSALTGAVTSWLTNNIQFAGLGGAIGGALKFLTTTPGIAGVTGLVALYGIIKGLKDTPSASVQAGETLNAEVGPITYNSNPGGVVAAAGLAFALMGLSSAPTVPTSMGVTQAQITNAFSKAGISVPTSNFTTTAFLDSQNNPNTIIYFTPNNGNAAQPYTVNAVSVGPNTTVVSAAPDATTAYIPMFLPGSTTPNPAAFPAFNCQQDLLQCSALGATQASDGESCAEVAAACNKQKS